MPTFNPHFVVGISVVVYHRDTIITLTALGIRVVTRLDTHINISFVVIPYLPLWWSTWSLFLLLTGITPAYTDPTHTPIESPRYICEIDIP